MRPAAGLDGTGRQRAERPRLAHPAASGPSVPLTRIGHDDPVTEQSERPWGRYSVLAEGGDFKVKTIEVAPSHRLSYQQHSRRAEHWFVVAGQGVVTLDGEEMPVRRGTAVDVPAGVAHRVHNTGPEPLVFVEVQQGDYLGEDDIVRLEDDYGRSSG